MRRITFSLLVLCTLLLAPLSAQEVAKDVKKAAVKSHLKQHFKPYGFIRNYFAYDSRESMSGTGDLYYFQPYDVNYNVTPEEAAATGVKREDLNAVSSFRFLSITTRLGLDIVGYKWRNTEFGAKVEVDFYAALTGTVHKANGAALLRLRQAYLTLAWDSLRMNDKDYARVDLLLGQAWHPMAADLSDVIALNSGAPFGPFSRTPMVKMDARLGKYVTLTGAALWQMQYMSLGPKGSSAEYIAYSKTPEAYLGLSIHDRGFLMRVGADVLSICPRVTGAALDSVLQPIMGTDGAVQVTVSDRITTVTPFLYVQYKHGDFSIKAKTVLAEAGEHLNMNGGYGVSKIKPGGSYEYTPTRTSSTWVSLVYGGRVGQQEDKHPQMLQGILFGGYIRNFGTTHSLVSADLFYYPRVTNLNRMWRLTPTLLYTVGRFQLGLEYEITSAQYGDAALGLNLSNGLADRGLHWVTNHRLQLMTKFNF
ncbi:MAG: hypothetical protein IJP52_03415 [Paludibacteraceae bacterium]|nr:hypothetical protein [Paludibacteraceae bacterium]